MYYIMVEKNAEPYYLIHAGDGGEERVWSTDVDEALEFYSSDAAQRCNESSYAGKGTIVRIGDEEMEWEHQDDEWI